MSPYGLRSPQLWMSAYHNKTQCVFEPGEVPSPHCAIALDWLDWSATLPFWPVNTEGKLAAYPSTAAPVGNPVAIFFVLLLGYPVTFTLISGLAVQFLWRYTANSWAEFPPSLLKQRRVCQDPVCCSLDDFWLVGPGPRCAVNHWHGMCIVKKISE